MNTKPITKINPIDPHADQSISILDLSKSIWCNRELIIRMTKCEVLSRYKGSMMGLAWSFVNPVFMLIIYTIVFSEIFQSRWGNAGSSENKAEFAMVLFVGMIVFNLFSEVANRSPNLIVSNVNYVKKVVFPLETLSVITTGASLFHFLMSLLVLLIAILLFNNHLYWTILFLPLVLLPLLILTIGVSWILASIGVFIRDVGQTIGVFTSALMFITPIFYPLNAVPQRFQVLLIANPLTFIVEQARDVIIWGLLPNWFGLLINTLISTLIAWVGFIWFQKTRKGFADVL